MNKPKYFYGLGRRKESRATVRVFMGSGESTVNGKGLNVYFPSASDRALINEPLKVTELEGKCYFTVMASGGGKSGQRDAVILGIARAVTKFDASLKTLLKKNDLTGRDPRMVERKHTGRRKARKSEQYSKR